MFEGSNLDSVSPGIIFSCVAIACNIFIFPFLYIQALAIVFPNDVFLHRGGYKLLCLSDDVTNRGCWPT